MSLQTWEELLLNCVADQTAVTSNGADTALIPSIGLPANYFYAGRMAKLSVRGVISNVVTTPGTLTLKLFLNGTGGTLLVQSAAISQNIIAQTNDPWDLDLLLTCRQASQAGAQGKLIAQGKLFLGNVIAASVGQVQFVPSTAPAEVGSLDLRSSSTLDLTARFSVAGNSMTAQQYAFEALN